MAYDGVEDDRFLWQMNEQVRQADRGIRVGLLISRNRYGIYPEHICMTLLQYFALLNFDFCNLLRFSLEEDFNFPSF